MKKTKPEYRVIEYSGRYYFERLKSEGIWDILKTFDTEEEAKKYMEEFI